MKDIKNHASLTTDLEAHWPLSEPSGTRKDMTANANHLTDNNTVGMARGLHGNAADFELANSEYLNIADNASVSLTDDISFSLWVKVESLGTRQLFCAKSDQGTQRSWNFEITSANIIKWFVSGDGTTGNRVQLETATGFVTADIGNWVHIVGVFDRSAKTMEIYKNGVLLTGGTYNNAGAMASVHDSTKPFTIGAIETTGGTNSFFDGLMQGFSMWSRTLTTAEIADLYNGGVPLLWDATVDIDSHATLKTNCQGHWSLEEITGTRSDDTANGNDLTEFNSCGHAPAIKGGGVHLETSNSEYLAITDAAQTNLNFTGDISVACWANFESDVNNIIASKHDSGTEEGFFIDYRTSPDRIRLIISSDGAVAETLEVNVTLTMGVWYHIVVTWDASTSTMSLYVDGLLIGTDTGSLTSIYDNASDFMIGRRHGTGTYTDGIISKLGAWSKVLTLAEVLDHYNHGAGLWWKIPTQIKNDIALSEGLKAAWEMEETSGVRYDSHGTNHLTDNDTVGTTTGKMGDTASQAVKTNTESLSIADNADMSPTGDFTLSLWYKPRSDLGNGVHNSISGKDGASNRDWGHTIIGISGVDNINFLHGNGASMQESRVPYTGGKFATDQWYYLTFVFVASESKFYAYVNGALQGEAATSYSSLHNGNRTTHFHRFGDYSGDYGDNAIDDMLLYHKALSAGEIIELYSSDDGLEYEAATPPAASQNTNFLMYA